MPTAKEVQANLHRPLGPGDSLTLTEKGAVLLSRLKRNDRGSIGMKGKESFAAGEKLTVHPSHQPTEHLSNEILLRRASGTAIDVRTSLDAFELPS